jgi:predicted PurR-regulated permease PerM
MRAEIRNEKSPRRDEPAAASKLGVTLTTSDADNGSPITIRMPVDIRSAALTVLTVLAGVLALRYAQAAIIPIVLAVLISHALDPLVVALVRVRIMRPLASALVILALVGAGGVLVYQLRFQVDEIAQQLPEAARRLRRTIERQTAGPSTMEQVQRAAAELEAAADAAAPAPPRNGVTRVQVEEAPVRVVDYIWSGSAGIGAVMSQLALVLFLTYFLLASGDLYRRKIVKLVGPSLSKKRITVEILEEINQQIERFLLVQVYTSTLVGVATWLAFRWIGLEQAGVWGLLAGVFNSIPYFGPVLVTVGASVVAFLQFGSLSMVVLAAGLTLAITSLEGFLITPWLTSRAARMNAVAVFVGLIFWGWVWEVWGLLLAVPMLMVIKAICDHVEDLKGVSELLGE